MRRILIFLIASLFISLLAICRPDPLWAMIAGAVFLIDGLFRKYQGEYKPFAIVGAFHNAFALGLTYFAGLIACFEFGIYGEFGQMSVYAISFGITYQFGFECYLTRLLVGIPCWLLWGYLSTAIASYFPADDGENIGLFASLLLLGLEVFELLFLLFQRRRPLNAKTE